MISEQDIQRAAEDSAHFKPAILSVKYHPDTDRVETLRCSEIAETLVSKGSANSVN
jgi:hypothetical protein